MYAVLALLTVGLSHVSATEKVEIQVAGATRVFYVDGPRSETGPLPLVFVFHGHGGTALSMQRKMQLGKLWPNAIIVYMQGLPTPGRTDPDGRRNGWQKNKGEQQDRDLAFFDAALARLKTDHRVDSKRIYACGHSNGGRMTYLLYAERGATFAAIAPSGSPGLGLISKFVPKPVFHIAGEKDPIVPIEGQLATIQALRGVLQCGAAAHVVKKGYLTTEPGINNTELATYIHPGKHEYPSEAFPLMVEFFQRHPK